MTFRKEVMQNFIDKLLMVVPNAVAVYHFKRGISQYDKWLLNKDGMVIIIEESDNFQQNFMLIDLIYDTIQDDFGWNGGLEFATSFSRNYIRTESNLWNINIQNPQCLLPEDQLNLLESYQLVYGKDVLSSIIFPHERENILKLSVGLTREETEKIAGDYTKFEPLINPRSCWQRFDFTIRHSIVDILQVEFEKVVNNIQPENHTHIYGRYGGSGKTQIIYSLMKLCKSLKLPFIYRTEFWKDERGVYLEVDNNSENEATEVTNWLLKNIQSPKVIIFLDEVDVNLNKLQTGLKEKFSNENISYLIVSGGKDIPSFTKKGFFLFDIVKEYPFTGKQYQDLIEQLLKKSNINEEIFPKQSVEVIVEKTRIWNISSPRKTPTSIILAANLALAEAIKIANSRNEEILVTREIAEKWALLGTSPWYQKYGELHDVHAEYLIFDGENYTGIDRHYNHPLP